MAALGVRDQALMTTEAPTVPSTRAQTQLGIAGAVGLSDKKSTVFFGPEVGKLRIKDRLRSLGFS